MGRTSGSIRDTKRRHACARMQKAARLVPSGSKSANCEGWPALFDRKQLEADLVTPFVRNLSHQAAGRVKPNIHFHVAANPIVRAGLLAFGECFVANQLDLPR